MALERSLRTLALTVALLTPSGPVQESVPSNNLVVYSSRSNYCVSYVVDERLIGRPVAPLHPLQHTSWTDPFEASTSAFREEIDTYRLQ